MKTWLRNKALEFLGIRHLQLKLDTVAAGSVELCGTVRAQESALGLLSEELDKLKAPPVLKPVRKAKKGK